jgi:hypothetical protein
MTLDEVKANFGEPAGQSSFGGFTFYFYHNACEYECGFPDIVFFQNGQVVDAVLRATWRHYDGESSSPKGTVPRPNPGGGQLQMPEAQVEGVEIRPRTLPPAEPPDTARTDTTRVGG